MPLEYFLDLLDLFMGYSWIYLILVMVAREAG